ncbi:MAG: RDD family protein, partial [Betaproteobacteria bacterium]|nr:RDD family protein [Betaproteobacteria bacterium]
SRGAPLEGWLLRAHQAFLIAVFAAYFLWCWLRGGQTLAMKAWRIRLIEVTPRKALLRFLLALVLVPTGVGVAWALVDRDRQFLHDRMAGTRLVRA